MATFSMTDVTTWVHGYDFTTDLNQVQLKTSVDELEKTTFTSRYKVRTGGLKDVDLSLNGYWTDTADAAGFGALGAGARPVTISPTGAEGDVAYMSQLGGFSYEVGDKIGAMLPFTLGASAANKYGLVRGRVTAMKQVVAGTYAIGSPVNLGAASSGQFVYAALHVFSAGASITVQVESDVDAGFASPSPVGDPLILSAAGGVWSARVPGPIADTFYRLNVTAISGGFTIAGAIAVQ